VQLGVKGFERPFFVTIDLCSDIWDTAVDDNSGSDYIALLQL
jgi:hypothetical protein